MTTFYISSLFDIYLWMLTPKFKLQVSNVKIKNMKKYEYRRCSDFVRRVLIGRFTYGSHDNNDNRGNNRTLGVYSASQQQHYTFSND
jgi:hypothetical protein